MIIISNHNQFLFYFLHFYVFLYNKLQRLIKHVHLPHLCVAKDFWNSKILDQFGKVLKNLSFTIPHILKYDVFLMWLIGLYPLKFVLIKCVFIKWVLLIVLCKIGSCLTHCYSFLKVLNQNLNLKFQQMDFWFEFLDIHMNEIIITCHDCHGFKWQNINIQFWLFFFVV